MVAGQRVSIERKLHMWHKERSSATGEVDWKAHDNLNPSCHSCCCASLHVAENAAVMQNFKAAQGLVGGPPDAPPKDPQSMQRWISDEEI